MINYHRELVAALETILPTYYELMITADTKTPCISYQERNNSIDTIGDTVGYSRISYTVKVWGNDLATIQEYAQAVDNTLRPLGWRRISSGELFDINSTMKQKILTYEGLAMEVF